jgi:hypothetical protein
MYPVFKQGREKLCDSTGKNHFTAEVVMQTALIAAALTGICVITAFAADSSTNPQGSGQNLAQKKAEILKHIDLRIANSQEEKVCVQAAQSHDGLVACREKYRPKAREDHKNKSH